jgi:AcrR family transcriptional regulator
MPPLWNETIEAHRRAVRAAILDATLALVSTHGLSVTMSQIAERTGIGRATLYRYFPDVESILVAWHEGQVSGHLAHLAEVAHHGRDADERLGLVLNAYALMLFKRPHGGELAAHLHRDERIADAEQQLTHVVGDLIAEAARAETIRGDVAPEELARFCLHALSAATGLRSKAAVQRLVTVTRAGLRPARQATPRPRVKSVRS